MSKWIELWLAMKAAQFLQPRIKGWVISGPSKVDPQGLIGGWVYGEAWHLTFDSQSLRRIP